jgi:cytochrome c biogenesis protein
LEEPKGTQETQKKSEGGAIKPVWDFFTSLKLTVVLLIILALVSIIGTVIDQTDPNKNMQMLVGMFGPGSAPGVLNILVKVGLTHMYHSWWFVGLLTMLSANIAICTLDRFPRVWHMVTRAQGPLTDETLKGLGMKREIKIKGGVDGYKEKAKAAMKSLGYSPREAVEGGAVHYFAEKGKYSRLGVYITHTSVLIIFVGALIGSFWGYKGYVQIIENGSINSVALTPEGVPLLRHVEGNEMPLGYRVRCDKFELKLYEGSRMPSNYLSTLTIIDGDKEVMTKTIRVNDPLEYKSVRFYQSSYGVTPEMATMTIRATPKNGGMNIRDYKMRKNEKVKVEGSDLSMEITDMAPDVAMGPNNQLMAQSDQFKGSGAAALRFYDGQGNMADQSMIMNMDPSVQPQKVPYAFSIMNYNGPYYTGLQVTFDPGVWVVWTGCSLMVFGILVAFFTYHKRVWVRLQEGEKGQTLVTVGGSANKNRHVFEGEFQRLIDKLGG